jgi:hypothetical protein
MLPLVKAAGFWFVGAQAALLIAPTLRVTPRALVYLATAGFGVHSVQILLRSVIASGFSWRICLMVVACLAAGVGMSSTLELPWHNPALPQWAHQTFDGLEHGVKTVPVILPSIDQRHQDDKLGEAAALIFVKGTQDSVKEARSYLAAVPADSAEYKSAQDLLQITDDRFDQSTMAGGNRKASVEIVSSQQTPQGLRVTLRNNTDQSVRNIRYRILNFKVADGRHVHPDEESVLLNELPPREARRFDLSENNPKENTFRALSLVGWDSVPTS